MAPAVQIFHIKLMATDKKNEAFEKENQNSNAADTGNASNPSPRKEEEVAGNQLLNKEAEKYLRESGNIEDMPDANDQEDIDRAIREG